MRVVALGEVMVELSLAEAGRAAVGYAGDTFNTAVYLRRLGLDVAYATAIGAGDPFSTGILAVMTDEGLDTSLVTRAPGRLPGLYAIQRDAAGERRFFYWRSEAAVRSLFEIADLAALGRALASADLVYLSAITLAVVGEAGRRTLQGLLAEAAVPVALDTNYRARLWDSPRAALAAIEAVAPFCRYISTSADDTLALDMSHAPGRWAASGCEVVARGADHSLTVHGPQPVVFPAPPALAAVDTTGAGDSFNAGYLARRLNGGSVAAAVAAGRSLAALVVQHSGAIIPRAAMA
ncbi:sugar kinase [Phenylobacterium sp.]|uniref:sugar kinase n=1 Tax=Phenylobacterium sp. TaxID=1871053 RepID=UPI003982DC58